MCSYTWYILLISLQVMAQRRHLRETEGSLNGLWIPSSVALFWGYVQIMYAFLEL